MPVLPVSFRFSLRFVFPANLLLPPLWSAGLYGLGGFFVSLIVVAVALIICAVVAREMVLPFAVAEILTLVVVTSIYVVYKNVLAKKRVKK